MKKITVILFTLALLIASCNSSESKPNAYGIDLNKYQDSKEEVDALIAECGPGIIDGNGDNKCGFTLPPIDEFFVRHINGKTGYIYDPNEPYKAGASFFTSGLESAPDHLDLTELMTNGKPSIKQQQASDCWAWSTHHAYEIVQAVHDKKVVDNSVQTVISCSGSGTAAHGGYMRAVSYLLKGLPVESEFPYTGRDTKCKFSKDAQSWEPKIISAPYIGSSQNYSRYFKGNFRLTSIEEVKKAMAQFKGPAVVTVAAFNVGNGVYDITSQCNSGGNHMVDISGYDKRSDGKTVANVYNSWGNSFGDGGIGKILWDPKPGCLNRGLGVSARVVQYKPACQPAEAFIGFNKKIILTGSSIKMGKKQDGVKCSWLPTEGLSDPNSCETFASPLVNTEYHLSATNSCGTSSAMALVEVWGPLGNRTSNNLLTPFGTTTLE